MYQNQYVKHCINNLNKLLNNKKINDRIEKEYVLTFEELISILNFIKDYYSNIEEVSDIFIRGESYKDKLKKIIVYITIYENDIYRKTIEKLIINLCSIDCNFPSEKSPNTFLDTYSIPKEIYDLEYYFIPIKQN